MSASEREDGSELEEELDDDDETNEFEELLFSWLGRVQTRQSASAIGICVKSSTDHHRPLLTTH